VPPEGLKGRRVAKVSLNQRNQYFLFLSFVKLKSSDSLTRMIYDWAGISPRAAIGVCVMKKFWRGGIEFGNKFFDVKSFWIKLGAL
jgi:hypothetical protein